MSGIGLLGPGFESWDQGEAVLSDRVEYRPAPTRVQTPALLPAAERRRAGRVVKLALTVALEATQRAAMDPAGLASVFASSGGDGQNCHELCEALAAAGREISPTRFSNSVHNAAAGYWSIATAAKLESTVLCACDASFGAGLLEALTQVTVDRSALLLVAYDTEYPEPIRAKRPVPDAFAAAFVLTAERCQGSIARIEGALEDTPIDVMQDPLLEAIRGSIPAARCLPLLRQLARKQAGTAVIEYLDVSRIVVRIEPCS